MELELIYTRRENINHTTKKTVTIKETTTATTPIPQVIKYIHNKRH